MFISLIQVSQSSNRQILEFGCGFGYSDSVPSTMQEALFVLHLQGWGLCSSLCGGGESSVINWIKSQSHQWKKNGKEKEREIKSFSILFHSLSAFQNFHSGDLPSFKRTSPRYLLYETFSGLSLFKQFLIYLKNLHILGTWHSVLILFFMLSANTKLWLHGKNPPLPHHPPKKSLSNLEESNCAWEILLLPFFSLPSLDKFNLDVILPLPNAGWSPFC